jgi:hypothetical protein
LLLPYHCLNPCQSIDPLHYLSPSHGRRVWLHELFCVSTEPE